jgi:hypothetical protein
MSINLKIDAIVKLYFAYIKVSGVCLIDWNIRGSKDPKLEEVPT